jgi:UDP-GlcNAc3NAcA epimerase
VARRQSDQLDRLFLRPGDYVLVTCHRAENTDDPKRLRAVFQALHRIAERRTVVFPVHPRTRAAASRDGIMPLLERCQVIEPVSYLDMVALEQDAAVIVTDSGGVQKEAFFFGVPCITMRDETEWVETVQLRWNTLVGADADRISDAVLSASRPAAGPSQPGPYGSGQSALSIARCLATMQ